MENNLRKLVKKFERDPTVGSIDTDLLSLYSIPVIGMAPTVHRQRVVRIPRNSMENILRKLLKTFKRDPTVGFINTVLLSLYSIPVIGMPTTGRRRRVVRIRHNSMENSLRKLVKNFERDPTVRSIDTDV